jgi:hypothetical protein
MTNSEFNPGFLGMVVLRVVGLVRQDSTREEAAERGVNGAPDATFELTVRAARGRELTRI